MSDIECLGADPSTVTFSIEDASAVPFSLHPPAGSALVKLNRTIDLDYEAGPRLYQFNITCSDCMGSVSGTVQVTVTSVNEYPPEAEINVNGSCQRLAPTATPSNVRPRLVNSLKPATLMRSLNTHLS